MKSQRELGNGRASLVQSIDELIAFAACDFLHCWVIDFDWSSIDQTDRAQRRSGSEHTSLWLSVSHGIEDVSPLHLQL